MKKYKYKGKLGTVHFTKDEREKLLDRFNPDNFKSVDNSSFENCTPCILCDKYLTNRPCKGCTFAKFCGPSRFGIFDNGCTNFMRSELSLSISANILMYRNKIICDHLKYPKIIYDKLKQIKDNKIRKGGK